MKKTTNIAKSVEYPMTDKEEQVVERVGGVLCRGGLMDTGDKESIIKQFDYVLDHGGRHRYKQPDGTYPLQGYKFTFSFSKDEIDPTDPEWADKALNIVGKAFDKMLADDVPAIFVTQRDGKSGHVHVHGVACALHSSSLKALRGRETNRNYYVQLSRT
jgi:hypothetical protein